MNTGSPKIFGRAFHKFVWLLFLSARVWRSIVGADATPEKYSCNCRAYFVSHVVDDSVDCSVNLWVAYSIVFTQFVECKNSVFPCGRWQPIFTIGTGFVIRSAFIAQEEKQLHTNVKTIRMFPRRYKLPTERQYYNHINQA